MTAEEKVLEKIRKVLIADATLEPYLNKRVYASHISSITEPKYPAISLFLLYSSQVVTIPEAYRVRVQIDAWFPSSEYNSTDIMTALDRVRELLHLPRKAQELNDSDIGIIFYQSLQSESGPVLYEDDTELLHLPSIFEMVVK